MQMIWFIVPVHGRLQLAQICLRQLRHTCNTLTEAGIAASAVVISDSSTLSQLEPQTLGFATVERDNQFLGRKFNDGIQLATDPAFNPHPADYIVPLGSDDWVDHRLFLDPPPPDTIVGFQHMTFVREDGQEMVTAHLNYQGGAGIRIIPAQLVEPLGYRPADEDRYRACDTSILTNIRMIHRGHVNVEHRHLHDAQIVDWKSTSEQLNSYQNIAQARRCEITGDPFTALADIYPADALAAMEAYYETVSASKVAA